MQPLLSERVDVTVIDTSVERIRNAGKFGFKVYFGDGCRLDVLRSAGAGEARIIAICVGDRTRSPTPSPTSRGENFPMAKVFARAYDRIHAIDLLERGVDCQIRETLESALAFGGAALVELRGDPDRAREVVDHVRQLDSDRLAIQQAGGPPPPFYQRPSAGGKSWQSVEPSRRRRGGSRRSPWSGLRASRRA